MVTSTDDPIIVMGDFNASVWSSHFQGFMKAANLHDTGHKRGFQATWHRSFFPIAIPIDHILHSAHFRCTNRTIGPGLGSDHRPVVADLAFTRGGAL